jgi:TRAP-type C4-dicarboxylate transport system substrate-binding protein
MRSHALTAFALMIGLFMTPTSANAQESVRISHSWPENANEFRHEVAERIAASIGRKNIRAEVFGAQRLLRAREQWQGLKDGTVDIVIAHLPDAVPQIKEFEIFAMPGVAMGLDHAMKIVATPAMSRLAEEVVRRDGILIAAHFPQSTFVASTRDCVTVPTHLEGKSVRGAGGNTMNLIIEDVGGTPVPIAQPDIAQALRSGALDAFTTSPGSMISGRYQKDIKCMSVPGDGAIGVLVTSILVSKRTMDRLGDKGAEILAAVREGAALAYERSKKSDAEAIDSYAKEGVAIREISAVNGMAWRIAFEKAAAKSYSDISPLTAKLLEDALATP